MPRALLSVADKRGIVEFARGLVALGFEIVSTGGTQATLAAEGIPVRGVSDVTGSPEIMEGRVKTLHPAIHGGLLARRDVAEDMATLAAHGIAPIDLVAVNLYPFAATVSRAGVTEALALENIDIGGPAMIRAAAKNFPSVLVVVDPDAYPSLLEDLQRTGLERVGVARRRALAATAFAHVAGYDAVVAAYLTADDFPERAVVAGDRLARLRYGENPHQSAALYAQLGPAGPHGVAGWQVLAGADMSYNNYVDADAAVVAVAAFDVPACAIIKHANPCGLALAADARSAFEAALASDPVSAFGGVVAFNRPLDELAAEAAAGHHFDIVAAPAFDDAALARLRRRKNLRLVATPNHSESRQRDLRQLNGGFLLQERDTARQDPAEWRVVSERPPTPEELSALAFAWQVVRAVTSNAIVLARGSATVGIGGGQPNRVDAVRIAVGRAGERARGSVMASDAFFPFADNIDVAAAAGVTAIVAPGGSRRDPDVIAAADAADIAMVFTGMRHFRH